MKACLALCFSLWLASPSCAAERGRLDIPDFAALSKKASESVNVQLDSNLLGFAAGFLNKDDPEEAAAKKIVASLTGIYVRKYTFDADYAYPQSDIEGVRRQLNAPGWSRIVEARSNKEHTNVDVFVLIDGGKARGLAIIAAEPREFAIVNIVGSIDLAELHDLEGRFGVPELGIETGKKPDKAAKPGK
jgi:hypothetical protein